MIWLFNIYLIGILFTFFTFTYDSIKSKELGMFDGFGYLMISMTWPFLWSMHLGYEIQEWYYKRISKNESESNSDW